MTPRDQTERYLKRATRGLWGKRRREVREELEIHLRDRIQSYRLAGLTEAEAAGRTLRELGHPKEVSSGMARLYTLPTLIGSSTLVAVICALAVVAVSSGAAQSLAVFFQFPSPACLEGKEQAVDCGSGEPWTSVEALKAALEPQGVGVTADNYFMTLEIPGAQPVRIALTPSTRRSDLDGDPLPLEQQAIQGYLTVWDIIREIAGQSGETVRLEGWEQPTLQVGDATLRLSDEVKAYEGAGLYQQYMNAVAFDILNSVPRSDDWRYPWTVSLRTSSKAQPITLETSEPGIYGLFAILEPTQELLDVYTLVNVAPSNAQGVVRLGEKFLRLTFVGTESELVSNGVPVARNALLVRLTGEADRSGFGYEVIPPEQVEILDEAP